MINNFFHQIPKDLLNRVKNIEFKIESSDCNLEIQRVLEKTVLDGGKRLRPLLTHLSGNFFDQDAALIDPYARAIEMVHAASLAHDDVVDNATIRRDKPSINNTIGNKKAVLAGDYLLADVIVQLTACGNLKLVYEMSKVIMDLAEGEWIQLDAAKSRNYSSELIDKIAMKKTSSVMSFCCVAPAILAGQSESIVEYMRKFGQKLGLAFQLIDDTLDFSLTSKKDYLLDLENDQINSALYYVLKKNESLMSR